MNKILFISLFLALFAGLSAQSSTQDGPQISNLMLIPFRQPPALEGMQMENRVGVEFKIDQPEMVSGVVIVLKKRDTGAEVKTGVISFLHEEGSINYVYENRKRALNLNYVSIMMLIGEEQVETLAADAYIIDKNGNHSDKTHF